MTDHDFDELIFFVIMILVAICLYHLVWGLP